MQPLSCQIKTFFPSFSSLCIARKNGKMLKTKSLTHTRVVHKQMNLLCRYVIVVRIIIFLRNYYSMQQYSSSTTYINTLHIIHIDLNLGNKVENFPHPYVTTFTAD